MKQFDFKLSKLPLVRQVSFIPHQHDYDITSSFCSHIINPFGRLLERIQICMENNIVIQNSKGIQELYKGFFFFCKNKEVIFLGRIRAPVRTSPSLMRSMSMDNETNHSLTCNIIDHHCNSWVSDVAGNEATKPLLACCVPELKSDLLVPAGAANGRKKTEKEEIVL